MECSGKSTEIGLRVSLQAGRRHEIFPIYGSGVDKPFDLAQGELRATCHPRPADGRWCPALPAA